MRLPAAGYQPIEADKVAKTIPLGPGWPIKAEKEVAEFHGVVNSDPRYKELVETAKRISASFATRSSRRWRRHLPRSPHRITLYRSNEGGAVTAYEMGILEKIGLQDGLPRPFQPHRSRPDD
ncbi:MAG: hypothetical protein R2688_08120 [Fimbriimonadaceae bacterium]